AVSRQTPVSCKMATGTRSIPARKATRISQKAQRHRRRTPTLSRVMKPSSAARKAISTLWFPEGLVIDLWWRGQEHQQAGHGQDEEPKDRRLCPVDHRGLRLQSLVE